MIDLLADAASGQAILDEVEARVDPAERRKVREALDWLLAQPKAARAYVVLSHPTERNACGSHKFVQFCVRHHGLVLDLPDPALFDLERVAARRYLGTPQVTGLYDDGGQRRASLTTYQSACGDDVEHAVGAALVTFVHVLSVDPVFVVERGHTEDGGGGGGGQPIPRPEVEGNLPAVTS